jgi:hypothetical protein
MIQLFYDGLGVTNPLRGQGSLHNVGVFYFTVKNLPHEFHSSFGNVHSLALCYSHDLTVYGYAGVLEKIVLVISHLSTHGFDYRYSFEVFTSPGHSKCCECIYSGNYLVTGIFVPDYWQTELLFECMWFNQPNSRPIKAILHADW